MSAKLEFYNTMGREYQEFLPEEPGKVKIYTCGPTVYNYAHIGNLRAYVFADTLRRTLEYFNFEVNQVMNITDVGHLTDDGDAGDDKMELQAQKKGKSAWELAEYYTDAFFRHTGELNIKTPHIVCKATDHIKEQIEMVEKLEKNGMTYKTSDGIYFDSSKFKDYGKMAKLKVDGLRGGERVDLGEKKHNTDFALWKFSGDKKRQMEWESPWGVGFPGWHIECSAMATRYLGDTFDIHTGGIDHIPVHHTNEIAQSECASGKAPFVKYWLHGEFLILDQDEKMSKSKDNFLTLDVLKERGVHPLEYRYFLINGHYRSKLKFSMKNLEQAQNAFRRLKEIILRIKKSTEESRLRERAIHYKNEFEKALAHDMDTPRIMANFWTMIQTDELNDTEKWQLALMHDEIFGLGFDSWKEEEIDVPERVQQLLKERDEARAAKDWDRADKVRAEISSLGFTVVDSPEGSKIKS